MRVRGWGMGDGGWGALTVGLALIPLLAGCGGRDARPNGALRLDLDKRDPERLLRVYLGGALGPDGGDPFESGLVTETDGALWLHPDGLPADLRPAFETRAADGVLDWDGFAEAVQATYPQARALPPTLDAFREGTPYGPDSAWFSVGIDGVMTTARRRVFVPMAALRAALRGYRENGERLIYPAGTTVVGEHREGEDLLEVTAMRKRADGEWDFFVYGPDGQIASQTSTPPRALKAPTQCVGCHVGRKLYEPERSFPAEARPGPHGPHGPRMLHVPEAMQNAEVVAFFQEHAKRSDTVLGIYNTLLVSQLLAERDAGRLDAEDAALLDGLGL